MGKQEEVVSLCQKMIQAQSYSGKEQDMAQVVATAMKEKGFSQVHIDRYGNVIGKIQGAKPGKKVLFDGHMDTVPVSHEKEWECPPFAGKIKDGKLYGRGSSDMKGALAAMICGAADYAEKKKGDFCGEIYVAGVVQEELFEGIAAREIDHYVKPDYVVIGEASQLNLKIGQRGRAEVLVETFGKPSHSAHPEKGINAVYAMSKIIEKIRTLETTIHPVLGRGILELVDIKSEPYPGASVVPEYCCATYDRRLLVGETKEGVLEPLRRAIQELEKEDSGIRGRVSYACGEETCYTGETISGEKFFPAWLYSPKDKFVQDVYLGLQNQGLHPAITQYDFCTNGSHYAGEANIPTIGFGPSQESLAHTVNEYIQLDQLQKAMEGYRTIAGALLK